MICNRKVYLSCNRFWQISVSLSVSSLFCQRYDLQWKGVFVLQQVLANLRFFVSVFFNFAKGMICNGKVYVSCNRFWLIFVSLSVSSVFCQRYDLQWKGAFVLHQVLVNLRFFVSVFLNFVKGMIWNGKVYLSWNRFWQIFVPLSVSSIILTKV